MNVALVLRKAHALLSSHDFAPGVCSLTAMGNPALPECGMEPVAWCLDDALLRVAEGNVDLAHAAYVAISDAAGGDSAVVSWDEATGYCIDRPKNEVLRLIALAAARETTKARRTA